MHADPIMTPIVTRIFEDGEYWCVVCHLPSGNSGFGGAFGSREKRVIARNWLLPLVEGVDYQMGNTTHLYLRDHDLAMELRLRYSG